MSTVRISSFLYFCLFVLLVRNAEFKRYLALKSIDYVIQRRTARWQYCG